MKTTFSRRSFIKGTSLAAALPALAGNTTDFTQAAPEPAPRRGYWNKGTRLAISMWDFSWLHASYPGGPYADLERRVVEAVERGYNTLRVDCFPGRILDSESHFEKNWDPAVNIPQWGQRAVSFSCNVGKKVSELAALCRKHGLWLGLDSWDNPSMFGNDDVVQEADEEKEFTRFGMIWAKALKRMREEGVLERAVWIAPMNEVPHYGGHHLQAITKLREQMAAKDKKPSNSAEQEDAIYRRVNGWIAAPIYAEVSAEKIPISYSSISSENYGARVTDHYDVVDVHFMPGVIGDAEDQKRFKDVNFGLGFVGGTIASMAGQKFRPDTEKHDVAEFSEAWAYACRRHYRAMLKRVREYHEKALTHLVLPSGKKLTAIITESFGPCFFSDHPKVNWDWYKRYNADALRIVSAMDFKGSSLSNYAEPLFSLWQDADWHWMGTNYFLGNG